MIFAFKSAKNATAASPSLTTTDSLTQSRLIDISLLKLSHLQMMGKARMERRIVFVLDVLQWALHAKSQRDNKSALSVTDMVCYFEQEIYESMDRMGIEQLPRLWIDLPGTGKSKLSGQPFRIKASFTKRK